MKVHQINTFLAPVDAITRIAGQIRASIHNEIARESVSRFIKFAGVEGEPFSFSADAFHVSIIGRFEISKFKAQGRDFVSGQYSFFTQDGDKEVRLPVVVRFTPPNHVVLPDGNIVELIQSKDPDDEEFINAQLRQIKDAISAALLAEVINNLEVWTNE